MKNFYEMPTPQIAIQAKTSRWKQYEIRKIDGFWFVRGYDRQRPDRFLYETETITSHLVLYDMLETHKKLSPEVLKNMRIENIEKNITENDCELVLSFCKKYGFPVWGNQQRSNPCTNDTDYYSNNGNIAEQTLLKNIAPFASENCMFVSLFIFALRWLYKDFQKVVAYTYREDDINNVSPFLLEKDKKTFADKIRNRKRKAPLYLPGLRNFIISWEHERLVINCENLIHAAVYYLCSIYQAGETEGVIKICRRCGNQFVANPPQKKYCCCSPQAYYNYQKRHTTALKSDPV